MQGRIPKPSKPNDQIKQEPIITTGEADGKIQNALFGSQENRGKQKGKTRKKEAFFGSISLKQMTQTQL